MKVSCIITSFNRPKWVRQAIKSVADQTHPDFQLVVIDESTLFDIHEVLKEFSLPDYVARKYTIRPEQRRNQNRLSINLNIGMSLATGDLLCFLADDDYFYPTWFEHAVDFFTKNPQFHAAYGKLVYSDSPEMVFTTEPAKCNLRYFNAPVSDPFNRLDHNQAIHRRFTPPFRWPETLSTVGGPDAHYFREIATKHVFQPIDSWAAVKRVHSKNLQSCMPDYMSGSIDGPRE